LLEIRSTGNYVKEKEGEVVVKKESNVQLCKNGLTLLYGSLIS
jgi:hypothetical protein